jgi:hypothetical protein
MWEPVQAFSKKLRWMRFFGGEGRDMIGIYEQERLLVR